MTANKLTITLHLENLTEDDTALVRQLVGNHAGTIGEPVKVKSSPKKTRKPKKEDADDLDVDDEEEDVAKPKRRTKTRTKSKAKKPVDDDLDFGDDDEDDDEEDEVTLDDVKKAAKLVMEGPGAEVAKKVIGRFKKKKGRGGATKFDQVRESDYAALVEAFTEAAED